MNVLLLRPLPPEAVESLRRRVPEADIRAPADPSSIPEADLDWAEVVFGNPPPERLKNRPRLRWLQIVSSGIDGYAAIGGNGFIVTTARGLHSLAIAEQLLMAMLMFARGQLHFGRCQQQRRWDRDPAVPFSLRGQVVGLVGFGAIAQTFAGMCRLHGLRLRAVRRRKTACPPELESLESVDGLDALLRESDHVVLALPFTSETRGLIDARRVALMKHGAYFYNVARGGLVDEPALLARLRSGTLAGAAMDVFEQEPLPPESPWWDAPNTLVFPHIAGHHRGFNNEIFGLFADNLVRYATGQPLLNVANFKRGY